MNAVGYIRVSTECQSNDGVSLEAQEQAIHRYCELHGIALLEIYSDVQSGKRCDNRRGLISALGRVCREKGVIVVYSLTRLARSTKDCIDIVAKLEKCGADLASITEKIDTTSPMGRFFFRLMASLAELERDQISQRTRDAMRFKRSRGERISRYAPYGHDFVDGRLVINEHERKWAAYMVNARNQGMTLTKIVKELQINNVPTKRGGRWQEKQVQIIIKRNTHGN